MADVADVSAVVAVGLWSVDVSDAAGAVLCFFVFRDFLVVCFVGVAGVVVLGVAGSWAALT